MMKRFLCGVMAVALVASTLVVAPDASAAAKVPKAKYTFNMNKANKNVVAVARKDDTDAYQAKDMDNGVLPETKNAKKVKLKYVKGKNKKALYLDRSSSYGAQLKGVKLGSKSWTVAFWVKSVNSLPQFQPVFFTGNKIVDPKNCNWVSITRSGDDWATSGNTMSPVIWSHAMKNEKELGFPWYGYQNADGEWVFSGDDKNAAAVLPNKWVHITLVVDAKDTCPYGEEGVEGYYEGYHGWTYVNGKLFGNGAVVKTAMTNSNLFFLGINAWDVPFKGYYDDVMLWNKALTAKQVKKVYKSK